MLKFADGAVLPTHAASEGTLLALALLAAVHSGDPPDVLLLDDLDRALHPR
ncbi:MAG TPA: AAA family ATPase, partial [Polyangiaceae bacterium]|nr:AAA family ATPase [Polyangiaceae bacterium]